MRITKVRIRNFLSVKDSGEIEVDDRITVLVGKNESGKTNLLTGIEFFRRDFEYAESDICTYCEAGERLESGEEVGRDIPMVTVCFNTDVEDRKRLKAIDKRLGRIKELKVTKFFDGSYQVESPEVSIEGIEIGEERVKAVVERISAEVESLSNRLEQHSQRHPPFAPSREQFRAIASQFLESDFHAEPVAEQAFSSLYNGLRGLPEQDDSIRSDIDEAIGRFEDLKSELVEVRGEDVTDAIMELLPSMIYFDEIDKLTDSTNLNTFLADRTKFKTLDNLLHLAGVDVEKLGQWAEYRRRRATERASAVITGLVNESWRQEKVKVRIGVDGPKLIVFVQDEVGGFDPPSQRSKGFQWFLAFYINFMAGSNRELKNTILLLDDPGVYLHPGGQRDLLRTLEKISGGNQVVFSTHLPFMIDRDHLERVRIVHKEKNEVGTVVKHKFWESDFDALEPI